MNSLVKGYMEESNRGALANRDELIVSHLPLVKYLVKRIAANLPSYLDEEDLISVAVIGLITSAERFEPSRGVRFKTFAEQRIKGTIYDELRSQDWFSRSVREKYKRLEREITALSHKLGRDPGGEEIAAALNMELDEYYRMLAEVHAYAFMSLDESWQDDEGNPVSLLDMLEDTSVSNPQNQLMKRQVVESLGKAIELIPEKERLVITLYYYEELNLKEIGEIIGLTESRVSQLHSQAIMRLRSKLKQHGG
ncbi:MAG TPA: FliA/WhiG family RNA polymerase sigma factor [Geobacteraceae bacterium]|nr:FliA/WhiG family RNA polymerase sigma factor [Geobacteraceae bacterium]